MKANKGLNRTKQRILFALRHPIARADDPHTSHLAADELNASGKHCRQLVEVLILVCNYPRLTSLELSRYSGLDRYQIARRLPELEQAGLVVRLKPRFCTVGHRLATIWKPIGEARSAVLGKPKRKSGRRKVSR